MEGNLGKQASSYADLGPHAVTLLIYGTRLFRDWLSQRSWQCESITLSGGTDCYQSTERDFTLTRQCLEVALEFRQPISIVTKNVLVLRDLDLLKKMAELKLIQVNISITSLSQELIRRMEPRTSSPMARLRAVSELSKARISTCALISPIIPGLNDIEIPRLLQAVSDAGAAVARNTVLRLPGVVGEIFLCWLRRKLPHKASLVESRIQQIRGGKLNDSRFGKRMSGEAELAKQIRRTFAVFAKRYGLDNSLPPLDTSQLRQPGDQRQRRLF